MADKRKFDRLPARLEVEIRTRGRGQVCPSVDISRHGMFLATANPPHERQLLILRIPIPDGLPAIDVMASVVRRVTPEEGRARNTATGVGINFFALTEENKERWDRLLAKLRGETPRPVEINEHANRPTFLLQPKDIDRLRLFAARELTLGTMFLRTPVLRQVGEHLKIVLLHPVTDEELPLLATVRAIHEDSAVAPKGMTLDFEPLAPELRRAIADFVENGRPPAIPTMPDVVTTTPQPSFPLSPQPIQAPIEEAISEDLAEAAAGQPAAPAGTSPLIDANAPEADEVMFPTHPPVDLPLEDEIEDEPVIAAQADPSPESSPPEATEIAASPAEASQPEVLQPEAPPAADQEIEIHQPMPLPPAPNGHVPPLDEPGLLELRAALTSTPEDVGVLFRLGSALARHPATATEALAVLARLQEVEPHHPLANGMLALAYAQLGQSSAAQRHVTRARRLGQPVDSRVQALLAQQHFS